MFATKKKKKILKNPWNNPLPGMHMKGYFLFI